MNLLLAFWLAVAQDQRSLLAELETYDERITALEGQIASLEERARARQEDDEANRRALADVEKQLTTLREATATRLRTFYRLKRRGVARLLFDAESPFELRRRARYLLQILRADEARTRAFAASVEQRRAAAEKVEADNRVLDQLQADMKTQLTTLKEERASRASLVRDIREKPALAVRVVAERAEAAATLGASLRAREATAPVDAGGGDAGFRAARGRLPAPVEGRVVRGFGSYVDPASGATASNLGVDFAAGFGAPFRAVAGGIVTRAGYVRGYGQVVVLQHGSYTTLYAHANGLRVAQGQTVERGQVLGLVGNTGLAEDAEALLHFELRYNGTPQDPAGWLGG